MEDTTKRFGMFQVEVQEAIDLGALNAIEARFADRLLLSAADSTADRLMAVADASDFAKIKDDDWRLQAASIIADKIKRYPDYRQALDAVVPGLSPLITTMDMANLKGNLGYSEQKQIAQMEAINIALAILGNEQAVSESENLDISPEDREAPRQSAPIRMAG